MISTYIRNDEGAYSDRTPSSLAPVFAAMGEIRDENPMLDATVGRALMWMTDKEFKRAWNSDIDITLCPLSFTKVTERAFELGLGQIRIVQL